MNIKKNPCAAARRLCLLGLVLWSMSTSVAIAEPADLYRKAERAKNLIAWISGSSGEGAAVVYDVSGTVISAMTAKHVVWHGGPLTDLSARFRAWPEKSFAVKPHRFHHDRDFAAVEIDLASSGLSQAEILRALPFNILGSTQNLEPGAGTFPVGHSSGRNWLSPESPATFNSFDRNRDKDRSKDVIQIEMACPPGHSGGGLFDDEWRLIGIIFEDDQTYCRAWRIDWALSAVQQWKSKISLTKAPAMNDKGVRREQIAVAIMDFDNRSASQLPNLDAASRDVISSYLVDLPRVVLVTRDRLASVNREMRLTGTQRSEKDMAKFGRLLHADAIVTGSILRYDVERRSLNAHGAQATVDVYRMDISLLVVDVETGRIAFSKRYDVEDKRTSYPKSGQSSRYDRPVDRSAELLGRLLDKAVGDLRDGLSKLALGLPAGGQLVSVSITSAPSGADVMIGGVFQGNTPLEVELEVGLQEVEIERPGFFQWIRRVKIEPGLPIHANLVPNR